MTASEIAAVVAWVLGVGIGAWWLIIDATDRAIIVRSRTTVIDHVACDSVEGCDATICCCRGGRCKDTVELACTHYELLCPKHRHECMECRRERAEDMWVDGWRDRLLGWVR